MFRPFIAIDIETTGIPGEFDAKLLEVSMVYNTLGFNGVMDKKELTVTIKYEKTEFQNEKVRELNQALLLKKDRVDFDTAKQMIQDFITAAVEINDGYEVCLAAKNMQTLVGPMIKNLNLTGISYRNIDVPSLYYLDMNYIADFNKLEEFARYERKNKSSIEDARMISFLVEKKVMYKLGF